MMTRVKHSAICWFLIILCTHATRAETMTAESHYEKVMQNPRIQVEGQVTGEGFCWHAAYSANDFVTGYEAYGDAAWLDQAVRYFDWLVDRMATGPDGYKGWIGPFIYDDKVWCDVHVGDAILFNPMLRFAEVVRADEGLRTRYGASADRYIALAKKHLIEKWDARGTYREDGPYGAYISWDRYLTPGDWSQWREIAIDKSTLSLPFNKQFDMGIACLRLWRMTGEAVYLDKAERIFRLMKSRIRLVGDYYVWHYWEPLGPWDVAGDKLRHWVGVHPYRNYQAGEIHHIVEAYHSGIVFDQADMARMVRTNLKVMWNGDPENPQWRNSDAKDPWAPPPPPPKGWNTRAGALWSGLKDVDETVQKLYERGLKPGSLAQAHYEKTKQAAGFERRYATVVRVFDVPFSNGGDITMATSLPASAERGQERLLVCKVDTDGPLEIAVYTPDGARIGALYDSRISGGKDGVKGIHIHRWNGQVDGKTLDAGPYHIRWTRGDAYRETPMWVR